MSGEKPQTVYRLDYRPPDYRIEHVALDFDLHEDEAVVSAKLQVVRAPVELGDVPPLVLHGEELETLSVAIDGRALAASEFSERDDRLEIQAPPERFELETRVRIHPEKNTALSGLYRSAGMFCTQCEAHGFRRITWFLDRPDVMATYAVRIAADRERYPVLLSNGNRGAVETLDDGRHAVHWEDPFPKPSYLFALVAGNLRCHEGSFTTRSDRAVRLEIWVEPQNIDRCEHAMRSLQKAMRWDEETFGLEYDLDLYMIVAVNDFNMGAMENKGLNVFNAKYVLAKPETATDDEYEAIEAVIGHEYFHNWTGNRVTCRDWFQLTLKEGLTVFRDQQFTADSTSAAVKRIRDVVTLRTHQFAEDTGPMAHPIRPESYISMDNFYTATVYEKGAEVVRLYHTLFADDGFRRGMDLYFERHDGDAVTCDDFRAAMADANGMDLARFERWYAQPGTPRLLANGDFDATAGEYRLTLRQQAPALDAESGAEPLPIPVRMGLLDADGRDLPLRLAGAADASAPTTRVLTLEDESETFTFTGLSAEPVPSLLRGFSAPVKLAMERSRDALAFLLAHDSDAFARWDAAQTLAEGILLEMASAEGAGRALEVPDDYVAAMGAVLSVPELDGSLRSLMLALPNVRTLGQSMQPVDYAALHVVRERVIAAIARAHATALAACVDAAPIDVPYQIEPADIDARRLRNTALRYLAATGELRWVERAQAQFQQANNMTDGQAALQILVDCPGDARDAALEAFHTRWQSDPLVLDKWFSVQAMSTRDDTFDRVVALSEHPDFTLANPNRARSLVGAFVTANPVRFHAADGRPYVFLADVVLDLDGRNPQLAARLVSAFNDWRRFPVGPQDGMRAQLERIARHAGLSKDVFEIASRALG
ncbi:MAG: aminopeptidase N [Myxococcota bacterium]